MDTVDDPNEKIAYLRSCVIGTLVEQCAEAFLPLIYALDYPGL